MLDHTRLTTAPEYRCASCDDETRVQRHCTLPLRDPDAAQYVTARDERRCPVLDIPGWYWHAVRVDELLSMGLVASSDLDAGEVALVRDLRRSRAQVEREDREWRAKKAEILGRAT